MLGVYRFYPLLLFSVALLLGLALTGCDGDDESDVIPSALTGAYLGAYSATENPELDIENNGIFQGTVAPDGDAAFTVTTVRGVFTATGDVSEQGEVALSGIINGERIDFTGTLRVLPEGYSQATGTLINRTTNETGTWELVQQGLSVAGAPGNYTGNLMLTNILGTMTFAIDTNGAIGGQAIVEGTLVTLNGALGRNGLVLITGVAQGAPETPLLFYSGLEPDTLTMERGNVLYDDLSIGRWEARRAAPG